MKHLQVHYLIGDWQSSRKKRAVSFTLVSPLTKQRPGHVDPMSQPPGMHALVTSPPMLILDLAL